VLANFLQVPPVTKKDLLFNDIYFNPYVIQVVNSWVISQTSNIQSILKPELVDMSQPFRSFLGEDDDLYARKITTSGFEALSSP